VGLIQNAIERAGICTVGVSIVRKFAEEVRPPRTVFLKWPFGHPLGEPFHVRQQKAVLTKMLEALTDIKDTGTIVDLPYRWRRERY